MNKYEYLYIVQGDYGGGWEDVTASQSWKEARDDLKAYLENEERIARFRLIKRRVLRCTSQVP